MYKMIVIDDEIIVRRGIKETIDWSKHNVEIIGDASNGQEGYELIKKLNPDIVITDVKMPILTGTELATRLKDDGFNGIVIIISGYKDFEYAKSALSAGVFQYLLKPFANRELEECVNDAINKLKERMKTENILDVFSSSKIDLNSKLFRDIVRKNYANIDDIRNMFVISNIDFFDEYCIVIGVLDKIDEHFSSDRKMIKCIDDAFNDHENQYLLGVYHNRVVMVTNLEHDLIIKLLENAFKHFELITSEFTFSFGMSDSSNTFSNANELYEQAKNIAENKLFTTSNSILDNSGETKKYKKNTVEILKIIQTRYSENLTVKIVAEEVLISESSLMHLLKDDLGMTFNDILTTHRINEAKKLLLSSKYRINEVARLVGYSDDKYFTALFKKKTGLTPSKFILANEQ